MPGTMFTNIWFNLFLILLAGCLVHLFRRYISTFLLIVHKYFLEFYTFCLIDWPLYFQENAWYDKSFISMTEHASLKGPTQVLKIFNILYI
jgi:hypothetical protein